MVRRVLLIILLLVGAFTFVGCEVKPTVVESTRIEVPPDTERVVRLWFCGTNGNLVFDNETCNRSIPNASPSEVVATRYPGHTIIKIEQGKELFSSSVWTVFYVYLRRR